MNDCRLVMVEWDDSRQPNGAWQFLSDFEKPSIVKCVSVGWLIHDGDEVKALAPNMGDVATDSIQVSGVIKIPTRCVTRLMDLEEPNIEVVPTAGFEPAPVSSTGFKSAASACSARSARPMNLAESGA